MIDTELIVFIKRQLDREEWWAVEASRNASPGGFTPTGEHWRWVDSLTTEPVELDPARDQYLPDSFDQGGGLPALLSVERYRYQNLDAEDPRTVVSPDGEVETTAAGHIQNNDPATALADIKGKRSMVQSYIEAGTQFTHLEAAGAPVTTLAPFSAVESAWGQALVAVANRWREQPGFNSRWEL